MRTTRRCGTVASTAFCSHSAHRSCFFFSHDGQKERPRPFSPRDGASVAVVADETPYRYAGLWGADRLRTVVRRDEGRKAPSRSVRAAVRDLDRAGKDGLSKEQAAALIEKALVEAFGEIAEPDESERTRAVRAILDEVHFVRYAPQLGDYSDKIRALAARGADVVRRWA